MSEINATATGNVRRKIVLKSDSKLIVSNLGLAAVKGGLEIAKAHILYDDMLQAQASLVLLNCLHLLYLVTPYDVSEQIQISKPHYYTIVSLLHIKYKLRKRLLYTVHFCSIINWEKPNCKRQQY